MIKAEKTTLELNEFYEDSIGITAPYYIQRLKDQEGIVWFGLETNWKYFDGHWHKLRGGHWIRCEEPEYEKIYKKEFAKEKEITISNIYDKVFASNYKLRRVFRDHVDDAYYTGALDMIESLKE